MSEENANPCMGFTAPESFNPFPSDLGFDNDKEAEIQTPGSARESSQDPHNSTQEQTLDTKIDAEPLEKNVDPSIEAEMRRMKEQVYGSVGLDADEVERREGDIKSLVDRVQHLSLRYLKPTDVQSMGEKDRVQYEKQMTRKIKVCDFLKNYVGINLYQVSAKRKLNEAKNLRDKLESNLRIFEEELKGRDYNSGYDSFNQNLLENLPEYIKHDRKFNDLITHLEDGKNVSSRKQGLREQYREMGEKGRALTDFHDILTVWKADYQKKNEEIQDRIDEINGELTANPGNKDMIQERMQLNSEKNIYHREYEKICDKEQNTVRELSVLGMKYKANEALIALKESTINSTRSTIQRLNVGIEQFENYINTNKEFVVIGGHMAEVDYARNVADIINAGSALHGYATFEIIKDIASDIGRSDPIGAMYGHNFSDLNTQMQEQTRTDAERAKAVFR